VSIGQSLRSAVRTLVGVALLVGGLLPLCGCITRYPDSMRYPLRKDRLVINTPSIPPTHLDGPGQLNEWLAHLASAKKGDILDPGTIDGKDRSALDAALNKTFGTPAHPKVGGLDETMVKSLHLEPATLAEGSDLYRRHCLHCHGLSGDGQGPTAAWINPHPRDYRPGVFKFTSSKQSTGTRKPRRLDLVRTLTQGLEGTAMPAFGGQSNSKFGVLPAEQIEKLVSYVIHLSLRGQVEFDTLQAAAAGELQETSVEDWSAERLTTVAGWWLKAEDEVIEPGKYAIPEGDKDKLQASIVRGYKGFLDPGQVGCIKCHMDFGRRNNFLYDKWGTIVRPRDLTEGIFRGGRRPIDLYWRISGGINGAGMPDTSGALTHTDPNKPDPIWDLVNFVQALPYPAMLPDDIRAEIYPSSGGAPRSEKAAFVPAHPTTRPEAQE
jgi:mono/diheme cytochrome c family protein